MSVKTDCPCGQDIEIEGDDWVVDGLGERRQGKKCSTCGRVTVIEFVLLSSSLPAEDFSKMQDEYYGRREGLER